MTVEKLYNTNEVAKLCARSPKTIRRWIKDGRLKASQPFPGAEYRFSWADFSHMVIRGK